MSQKFSFRRRCITPTQAGNIKKTIGSMCSDKLYSKNISHLYNNLYFHLLRHTNWFLLNISPNQHVYFL